VPFIVFEIDGVERAVNADEALALLSALRDHAANAKSTLGYQTRASRRRQRSVARGRIRLSPEERRELLAAMEAAELPKLKRLGLSRPLTPGSLWKPAWPIITFLGFARDEGVHQPLPLGVGIPPHLLEAVQEKPLVRSARPVAGHDCPQQRGGFIPTILENGL
jgi:hypothetical protein